MADGRWLKVSLWLCAVLSGTFHLGGVLDAQATDPAGMITTSRWLILGPFRVPFVCNGNNDSLLRNHLPPSCIACQYPEEGDEVPYDRGAAAAEYLGPVGPGRAPIWRAFDDGQDDGDQDLEADLLGGLDDAVSWLATYVEYRGGEAALAELCVGSDDGVQVWLDGKVVHSQSGCRARGFCQDRFGLLIEKGLHRLAIAAWNRSGSWGLSLGLRLNGAPILDDGSSPDWVFHGRKGGAALKGKPCACPDPVVLSPRIADLTCLPGAGGGIDLHWTNPPTADPAVPIAIHLNGRKLASVSGASRSFEIGEADLPPGKLSICLINSSGLASCCDTCSTDERGFVRSDQWLVLGPFKSSFGCNRNDDSILGNHLAPSHLRCQYPEAGEEVDYDADLAVSDGYAGPRSPAGKPFWRPFDDGSANWDIDLDRDVTGDLNSAVSFLATYVERLGASPAEVVLCAGSDDGVQVWINEEVAHNNNACRGRGPCQDLVAATFKPGVSRIVLGIWDGGGGWGGSLALQRPDGTPITCDDPDWVFHGSRRPPGLPTCRVLVARDIPDTLVNGTSGAVTLSVEPGRGGGVMVIREVLPPGLTGSQPSHGGTIAGNTITWNLGRVTGSLALSYTLSAAEDARDADFPSTATVDGEPLRILGDSYTGAPQSPEGFIKQWNHLGPLAFSYPARFGDHGPNGACDGYVGAELGKDWILNAERTVSEAGVLPFPGLVCRPDYGSPTGARAAGLVVEPGDSGKVIRERNLFWKGVSSAGDTVLHNAPAIHGFNADDQVTLSATYVTNHTGASIPTKVELASDDSIQVFLDEVDVTQGGILECRTLGFPGEIQNALTAVLRPGENRILVKVADGSGPSGFRLRFQDPRDPLGKGLLPPAITVSFESERNPRRGEVVRTFERSTFALGEWVEVQLAAALKTPSDLTILEVLPDFTAARKISEGGALDGNTIVWRLAGVTRKTVSYEIAPQPCLGTVAFRRSSFQVGSSEAAVSGTSRLSLLPVNEDLGAGWTSADIATSQGGAQRAGDHALAVVGKGLGIRLSKDEFRFVSYRQKGEFTFRARIDCLDDPGGWGSAGLMARASDAPGAANIFLYFRPAGVPGVPAGSLKAGFRRGLGSPTFPQAVSESEVTLLPVWVQLQRAGGELALLRSSDGLSFKKIASLEVGSGSSQVNLPEEALVGLAVTSGSTEVTRASFNEVSGPAFTTQAPLARFRRGDLDSNGRIDTTDPVGLLGYLFLAGVPPACMDAADADDDGKVDLSDAVSSLNYQFLAGPPPLDPGPIECGRDPTPEEPELGCESGCP